MSDADISDNNYIASLAYKSPQPEPEPPGVIPDEELVANTLPNLPRTLLSKLHNNPTSLPHIWPVNVPAACKTEQTLSHSSYTKSLAADVFKFKNILPQLHQIPYCSTQAPLHQRLAII